MRHLRSVVYAIVLAPTVWVLCGMGYVRDPGFLPLLLAGVAYAILVRAPISPAGPLFAGVLFLGTGVWALASPSSYAGLWQAAGSRIDLSAPGHGLAAFLSVPLIATALSARRWQRIRRPRIPVIGASEAARGTARPAGTPVGVLETAIIERPSAADTTIVVKPAETGAEPPTEAIPTMESPPVPDGTEPAMASFVVSASGEITAADLDAVVESAANEGEPAEPVTESEPADEADRVTEPEAAAEAEPVAVTGPVMEADSVADAEPEPVPDTEPVAETEPAAEVEPGSQPEPVATADEAADSADVEQAETATAEEVPAEVPDEMADDEETAVVPVASTEREEERTQVIELLIAARPTEDLSRYLSNRSNGLVGDGDTTQVIRPREPAGALDRGEETQVIRVPPADGERTQVVRLPAARTSPSDSETTQVVRLSDSPSDSETTQVIRNDAERMAASGERTEAVPIPAQPQAQMSIVDAERPDPAEDPTTRLGVPAPDDDSRGRNTVDVRASRRIMTVLNLERPQDEVADDTRHLVRPPQPPQPRPDDDEEPTP